MSHEWRIPVEPFAGDQQPDQDGTSEMNEFLQVHAGADDEETVRINKVEQKRKRQEKVAAENTHARKRQRKDKEAVIQKTPEQKRHEALAREKRQERSFRREVDIMRGGKYYKLKDEMLERERAVRDARKNKIESRDFVERANKQQDLSELDIRANRINDIARAFYSSPTYSKTGNRAIGEIVTLVPQHALGYIKLVCEGEDLDLLPTELAQDSEFMKVRKFLIDGTSVLHKALLVGDLVEFEFYPNLQGTAVSSDDWKFANRGEIQWVAHELKIRYNAIDKIPYRSQMVPLEVRKYMLSLLELIEAEADLALYAKITQELEFWRRLLGEEYTNKPARGLMFWHVLLILSIASRTWLESATVPLMLASFFDSFTGSEFIEVTLPGLIETEVLTEAALVKAAQFVFLFKKHTDNDVTSLYQHLVSSHKQMPPESDSAVEMKVSLDKTLNILRELDSFPSLLGQACNKGYNTLRVKSKEELRDVDRIITAEKEGHSTEVDGLDPLPRLEEFLVEDSLAPENLPKNRAEGSWGTPEVYTRTAFELLRADTYREFQYSMHHKIHKWQEFQQMTDEGEKRNIDRPTRLMNIVSVMGVNYTGQTQAGRLCYTVRFQKIEHMERAWEMRMYDKGNLVAITVDRFKETIWWAVVGHRDLVLLSEYIVGLEFIAGDPVDLQKKLQQMQREGKDAENCLMVEANTVFFAGYRPVLEALQLFARNAKSEGHCPFEDFLVYGQNGTKTPPWVEHNREAFDRELKNCTEENTFDLSQERAIQGLANNFLLVQGPPGTGKSYTGVKMVDVILRTRYAALDKLNNNKEKKQIEELMAEARKSSENYQQMQKRCDQLKDMVMQDKLKRDNAERNRDYKQCKEIRERILRNMNKREKNKAQMREIDNQQSLLFVKIMQLEQTREKETRIMKRNSGPIQIITYKNHSLDEFMMDVMPSVRLCADEPTRRDGLVRFGSRSLCEELEQYNVVEHVRRYELEPGLMPYQKVVSASLRSKVDHLKTIGAEISHLQGGNLTVECMNNSLSEEQKRSFGAISEASIEKWVGKPYDEVLVSLEDAQRRALQEDKDRDEDGSDDGVGRMNGVSGLQDERDIYYTKAEQEAEDKQREKFMQSFSPVLPDTKMPKEPTLSFMQPTDIDSLRKSDRQELKNFYIQRHLKKVLQLYQKLKAEYIYLVSAQFEFRQQIKCDALQHAQVIGLTVTGCTINKELLNNIQPTILIVEEAAEILESQIISCLNQRTIQQVVLVGDHKQLRPIVRDYAIARDCKLDMSLFERMANNNIPVHNLTNQRRMVPAISQFVRPLYRELRDDDSLKPRKMHCELSGEVRAAGDIPGLGKPVWFWSHDTVEERSQVGLSVVNPMETKMIVWLVKYFMARGMSLNQMTVLTPYKGQLRDIKDALEAASVWRPDMACTVDRFQGDENDLMIVSLVRTQKLTEFIQAPDRMCVLLSRARFGMVILGNSALLDSPEVPHWMKTMETLVANNWIGPKFPMLCDRHPEATKHTGMEIRELLNPESAEAKIENFCTQVCGATYKHCIQPQVHRCTRDCHHGDHIVCEHTCGADLPCKHKCSQLCGVCFSNKCFCTESITENGTCYTYQEVSHDNWEQKHHTITREGCDGVAKCCERTVYVKLHCGHFEETRCDLLAKYPNEDAFIHAKADSCKGCRIGDAFYTEFPSRMDIHPSLYRTAQQNERAEQERIAMFEAPNDYVPRKYAESAVGSVASSQVMLKQEFVQRDDQAFDLYVPVKREQEVAPSEVATEDGGYLPSSIGAVSVKTEEASELGGQFDLPNAYNLEPPLKKQRTE